MKQFQYLVNEKYSLSASEANRFLNEMGKIGWELVNVVPKDNSYYSFFYFKRELTNKPKD